jgi:hypothetical protein
MGKCFAVVFGRSMGDGEANFGRNFGKKLF